MTLFLLLSCVVTFVFVCNTEQLEAFKKHMEAGETNTPAIIMGEENEDDTENGQSVCVRNVKWLIVIHTGFIMDQRLCLTKFLVYLND